MTDPHPQGFPAADPTAEANAALPAATLPAPALTAGRTGGVVTSAARLGLRERVRLLQQPAVAREHVGGRPTVLRWSGLAAG